MSDKKIMQVFEKEISEKDKGIKGHSKDEVTVSSDFKHSKLKTSEKTEEETSPRRELFSWIKVIVIAVAVALILTSKFLFI